jgi:outer membrane protein assembly factor BamD
VSSRPITFLCNLLPAALLALTACASAPPEPELSDFEELPEAEDLYAEGVSLLEQRRVYLFGWIDLTPYQDAIDKFQEVVDNYPYSQYAVFAELRIADAYYDQERWDEALSYYRDFGELHPEHELVPYTIYRTALCHSAKSPSAERDQSATREALDALDLLMSRYPTSAEAREAEPLWKELRTKLGEHVLGIGDFYLARDEYQSAAGRYRQVLDEYPGLGLDADALYKLGLCYTHMSREDDARRIFEVILENFEDSDVAQAAQDQIPAAN